MLPRPTADPMAAKMKTLREENAPRFFSAAVVSGVELTVCASLHVVLSDQACPFEVIQATRGSRRVQNGGVSSRKRYWPFGVAIIAFLVNLPLAHVWWNDFRLDHGAQVATADVTGAHALGADGEEQRYFVVYELPEDADPQQQEFNGQVGKAAYDEALASKRIRVEYLPDDPESNRPVARVSQSNLALYITLFADLTLLVMVALMLWVRRNAGLDVLATEDVRRAGVDPRVEELGGGMLLVRGDVLEINEDDIVIQAGVRRVRVVLGEFTNPVGHQQPAEVRGRTIPRS